MKRALIVLLLLAVVAGGLFAQLAITGHAQSGLEVVILDGGDPTLFWYGQNNGNTYRFRIGGSVTNEAGTAGGGGAIQGQAGGFGVDWANVWIKPLDILRLQVGTGGPGGFGSMGSFNEGHNAADYNISAVLGPIAGLSLGLGVNPGSGVTFDKATYAFGAKFAAAGLLNVAANLRYNASSEVSDAAAGVQVLALNAASGETGLTNLAVDLLARNLTDLGWVGIGPTVGFRVAGVGAGALTSTLQARVFIPLKDDFDLDYAVGLSLGVPFTSTVTGNLAAGFEGKAALPGARDNGTFDAGDWGRLSRSIEGGTDPAFIVKPSVSFSFGGGASLEAGWFLGALLADSVQMNQAIYASFGINF
jgi:hypothetical protein